MWIDARDVFSLCPSAFLCALLTETRGRVCVSWMFDSHCCFRPSAYTSDLALLDGAMEHHCSKDCPLFLSTARAAATMLGLCRFDAALVGDDDFFKRKVEFTEAYLIAADRRTSKCAACEIALSAEVVLVAVVAVESLSMSSRW